MKKNKKNLSLFLISGTFVSTSAMGLTVTPDNVAVVARAVDAGSVIFNTEKFNGNGRTCGTCHIPSKHYNIDPKAINTASVVQSKNTIIKFIENETLVRQRALFNIGPEFGIGNTPPGPMRTSMTIGAMEVTSFGSGRNYAPKLGIFPLSPFISGFSPTTAIRSPVQLGWGGEGSPDIFDPLNTAFTGPEFDGTDCKKFAIGTLNSFAIGAVVTHATKNRTPAAGSLISRNPGRDFTCPTADQLNKMDLFQRWLGRQVEYSLGTGITNIPLGTTFIPNIQFFDQAANNGLSNFKNDRFGCNACHSDAGANASFAGGRTARNFATNVHFFGINPVKGVTIPLDEGSGFEDEEVTDDNPRTGKTPGPFFNSQPLIEAAVKEQFFHNGSVVGPIESAIQFYFSPTFNDGPGGFGRACAMVGGVVGGDPRRCRDGVGQVQVDDTTDNFPTLASISQEFGANAINETGFFLRALTAWYKANDCLRLIDETLARINAVPRLNTDLPVQHIGFNLDDVSALFNKAPLKSSYYLSLGAKANPLKMKIAKAAKSGNIFELNRLKDSVQTLRDSIAVFNDNSPQTYIKTFNPLPYDPTFGP